MGFKFDAAWFRFFFWGDVHCAGGWVEVCPFEVENFAGARMRVLYHEHAADEFGAEAAYELVGFLFRWKEG